MAKSKSVLTVFVLTIAALFVTQLSFARPSFPGKAKLRIVHPPAKGQKGLALFYLKPSKDLENLTVNFELPPGVVEAGTPLTKKLDSLSAGKLIEVPFRFTAKEMGILRIGANAQALDRSFAGASYTWYAFFESGVDRGYSPIIRPENHWQRKVAADPLPDEFVKIAETRVKGRNYPVLRSDLRVFEDDGNVYKVNRIPVLESEGNVHAEFTISEPPLLGKRVTLEYTVRVNDDPGRKHVPANLLIVLPPNAFRIHDITWPEGGEHSLLEQGPHWRGKLPSDRTIKLRVDLTALTTGDGKIRGLFKATGRRREFTDETPLFLEVNRHSARVYGAEWAGESKS